MPKAPRWTPTEDTALYAAVKKHNCYGSAGDWVAVSNEPGLRDSAVSWAIVLPLYWYCEKGAAAA